MSTIQNPNGYDIIFSPNIDASSPYSHKNEPGTVLVHPTTIARLVASADIVITSSGPTLITGTIIRVVTLSPLANNTEYTITNIDATHFSINGTGSTGGSGTFSNGATGGSYIAKYDSIAGDNSFWVNIPFLSHTTDTEFYLFYNQAGVTTSPEDGAGTWLNAKGIYQFPYCYPFTTQPDSTNLNNLTEGSNVYISDSGQVERGVFGQNSGGDVFQTFTFPNIVNNTYSVFTWVKSSGTIAGELTTFVDPVTSRGYRFQLANFTGTLHPDLTQGGIADYVFTTLTVPHDTWVMLAYTVATNGTTAICYMYIPGVSFTSETISMSAAWPDNSTHLEVASSNGGYQDQTEIYNIVKTADWIHTEAINQSDASFITISAETDASNTSSYNFKRLITVSHTLVQGSSDFLNFPVVISSSLIALPVGPAPSPDITAETKFTIFGGSASIVSGPPVPPIVRARKCQPIVTND